MITAERIIDGTEQVMSWFAHTLFNHDLRSYCALETKFSADDPETLVADDGSLLTVFRLDGAMRMIDGRERQRLNEQIYSKLKGYFSDQSHVLNVYFESNPDRTRQHLMNLVGPSLRSAKRIGLAIEDVLLDQVDTLAKSCVFEECLVGIWTTAAALPPALLQGEAEDKMAEIRQIGKFTLRDAQDPWKAIRGLHNKHRSIIDAIVSDLQGFGLAITRLTAHEVVARVKTMVEPDTDPLWKPVLPGDRAPARIAAKKGIDLSHVFYPSLARQICSRRHVVGRTKSGLEFVRVGGKIFSALLFDLYPQEVYDFQALLRRIERTVPWRINFTVQPDGLAHLGVSRFLLNFCGFIGRNKEIRLSFKELADAAKQGEPNVYLRIALATWADNERDLERNYTVLSRAVQGWGGGDVTNDAGDPEGGLVSATPFFSRVNLAAGVAAPMDEMVRMLPLSRPASPWRSGAVLFRTPDGKVFPFEPGSSLETTWIYLIYAPPGSGKSVLLNLIARAFCVKAGLARLPFVAVIDVGPSSTGMIDTIASGLPAKWRHLTGKFLLRMTRDCAINPFDTQLGCRKPTRYEREFLVDLITVLGTAAGSPKPYDNVSGLAGILVDEVYERYSDADNGQPKRYEPNRDRKVDATLSEIKFEGDEHATWWEVTDALFRAGRVHDASLAQRYAVPLLSDLVEVLKSRKVCDMYEPASGKPAEISTGETLLAAMNRILVTACREYPILANETRFDLGAARIFSIDLEPVIGDGPEGEKRSALCYMLARNISGRNFFLKPSMVGELKSAAPAIYHAFHEKRTKEYYDTPKFLLMDELHNAGKAKSEAFLSALERDGRQGRKCNLLLALASQLSEDFPAPLVKMSTAQFILRAPDPETATELREKFMLSEQVMRFLDTECHGPGPDGAKFVAIFNTKRGRFVQGLVNQIGGLELWALSTTPDDRALRTKLYTMMPAARARKLLAERWPTGTAAQEIERRKNSLGAVDDVDDNRDVIDTLAEELARHA